MFGSCYAGFFQQTPCPILVPEISGMIQRNCRSFTISMSNWWLWWPCVLEVSSAWQAGLGRVPHRSTGYQCQRHEQYSGQWRAAEVRNCSVDTTVAFSMAKVDVAVVPHAVGVLWRGVSTKLDPPYHPNLPMPRVSIFFWGSCVAPVGNKSPGTCRASIQRFMGLWALNSCSGYNVHVLDVMCSHGGKTKP